MNDGGCVEEKKSLAKWRKIGIICGAIIAIGGVAKLWYIVDCHNIATFGDTLYAKDSDLAEEHNLNEAELKKLREQLKLEQSIRKAKDKINRYRDELRANLLFIEQVRKQYPVKEDIPGYNPIVAQGLFKEYKRAKDDNDKLEKKIDDWQKKLDELELREVNGG